MIRNLLLLIFFLTTTNLIAQQPPGACPGGMVTLTSLCSQACVLCDIDGFTGQNSITSPGEAPDGFCAPQLHNTQWVGFVAGSTSLTMAINVFGCAQNDGLQIGLYGTQDCENYQQVSNCDPGIPPGATVNFTATGLTIGGIYFIVVDGNFGDVCNFSVDVTSGSTVAPPVTAAPNMFVPSNICPGAPFPFVSTEVENASIYTWTINGQEVAYSQFADLSFPAAGNYTVCVTPSNPCNPPGPPACETVNVQAPPPQNLIETICLGESYQVGNQSFSQSGFYSVPVTLPDGCTQITNLNLTVEPPSFGFEEETLCPGETHWVGTPGQPGSQQFTYFDNPGVYDVHIQSASGCDSIVTFTLNVGLPATEIENVNICEGESVVSNGNTYTETGSYVHELTTVSGCDSTFVLVLVVDEVPEPAYVEATICEGEFYFLGNAAYDETGLYMASLETSGGCDSMVTLNLTVSAPETELNETICPGESVTVGNNDYNATGTFVETLTSSLGCDSVVTLNLEVLPEIETTLNEEICEGQTYAVGNSEYDATGTYTDVLTAADGCDSTVNLTLTVNPMLTTNLVETVCNDGSFSIGSNTYSATGSYQEMLTSAVTGCDSLVNLDLTVLDAIETPLNAEICEDGIYTVGTTDFDQAGSYEVTLQAANGCDSTVFLELDVVPIPETFLTESVCEGETFTIGNSTYDTEGEYTDILTASSGCDSVVYLDLTILPILNVTLNAAVCTGQTYTLGADTYDTPGTYSATFTSSLGCDSVVTVNLTIEDVLEEFVTAEICEGETYTVGSSTYDATGSYQDQFVTSEGCDSVLYLELIVNETIETNLSESICDGGSVTIGSSTYNTTGTFTEVLTSDITNCDSVVTLDLTVLETPVTNLSQAICDGESYSIAGVSYNTTGSFQEVIPAANGCDSTINLDLTVLDVPETALVESICDGTSYAVGDSTYTQAGIYQNVLVAANGCDSIVSLDLSILDVPETTLDELICEGQTYTVGTSDFSATGTYTETLQAANGCDSVVTLNLTVAEIPTVDLVASICDGASYAVGDSTYNASGTYQNVLTSSVGCDSIVNLELTVTDFYETNLVESICDGQSFSVGSSNYNTTGIYQDVFTSSDGCDSIVNLDLTVFDIPVTNLNETLCDGETYSVGNSTYDVTGTYQDILTSVVTGCDSIVNLELTVNPTFETNLVEAICDGNSYTVGSSVYTESGTYQDLLTASNGCDSMVNLALTVNPILQTDLQETLCFGETYTVGNSTYAQTGTYQDVLTSVVTGCDSIVTLDLTVPELIQTNLSETLCFDETYTVGNSTYNSTGIYQDVLTAANGCDSVVNLQLEIRDQIQTDLVEEICDGETFSVGGVAYNSSGVYQEVLTSVETGCDSTVNLDLTVVTIEETVLTQSICDGESVTVGTSTYTESGTYQDVLTSTVSGCDSVVSLDLTVFEIPVTNLIEELCFGETYDVGNTTFTESGTYQEVLTSVITGCDSVVNLDLTIPEQIQTNLDETLCFGETYEVGTSTYTSSGSYQDVLTATNGCDSVVSLELTIRDQIQTDLVEEICNGETYVVGSSSYASSGVYQDVLTSVETGCDSIVNLDLTVFVVEETVLNQSICDGESVTIGTSTYTESGSYQDVLTSTVSGCDSVVSLDLTVFEIPVTNLVEELCFGETYTIGTTTFSQSGTYQEVLTSVETGCDSIVNLDLTVPELISTSFTQTICFGESYTVGNSVYTETGSYQDVLTAANGCDSIVNLGLMVRDEIQTSLTQEICEGNSYEVGTSSYTETGSYLDVLTSVNTGCDSTVNLDLTVIPLAETMLSESICEGESVVIGTTVFDETGTYQEVLTSTLTGCDSVVHLDLEVIPIPEIQLVETICDGESYAVGGTEYTTTGSFVNVLDASTGCDSVVTLDLTVLPIPETFLVEEICQGETYTVGNSTYDTNGAFTDVLVASSGCDSIVHLDLTVNEVYEVFLDAVICDGTSYPVGGNSFTNSGTYTEVLPTVNGCDSVVTLNLTVHPCTLSFAPESNPTNCNDGSDGSVNFAITVGTPPYYFTWQSADGFLSGEGQVTNNDQNTIIQDLPAGLYTFDIIDSFDVEGSFQVAVEEPTPVQVALEASNYDNYNISCVNETNGTINAMPSGGTPPYSFAWSNGASQQNLNGLGAGMYEVTVTDQNGCSSTMMTELVAPEALTAVAEATDPPCFGDAAGSITIEEPSGGVGPYLYALENEPYSASPIFAGLSIGEYAVHVQDANGCTWTEYMTINEPVELNVDLIGDQRIELGETANLYAQTTYPVDSFSWKGLDTLGCGGCPSQQVQPYNTTSYEVTVVDENGCTDTDMITVFVGKEREVYIPNAFSPNGDGQNDEFRIFTGSDVAQVKSFIVFNRWGEPMKELFGFDPNDPNNNWDGTYRGQLMNSGVYVYFAEVEFIDGEVVMFKGDVLLMR